ncbi:PAC2 family protein [Euzebya sp.]|uniref:PAC2 family protein n=1 Tax=Euzebya sp. TaxID=1971409 RepID=UPI00351733B0
MTAIRRLTDHLPTLTRPTLFAAFEGWNDAGEAATGAVDALCEVLDAEDFADIDPEDFFDFQVTRPVVRWQDDRRVLEWPSNTFSHARTGGARDAVLLRGREPNTRWRTFTDDILDLARQLGVTRVVTLGALQVDVPHTRPVPVTGTSSDTEVAAAHGLRRSSYEGPTGIVGVLHQAAEEAGFEAVSLWVGVPHYLAGTAYQSASLAIARRVAGLLDTDLDLDELADEADAQLSDIAELVAEDDELAEYVTELESRADADHDPLDTDQLPSPPVTGEQLAAEFERYLRDRGE